MGKTGWFLKTEKEVLSDLNVEKEKGLSTSEAVNRLGSYGPNQLQAKKKINPLMLLLSQFKDVLVIILIISATVSLGLSYVSSEQTLKGEAKVDYYNEQYKVSNPTCGNKCDYYTEESVKSLVDPVSVEKESPKEALLIYGIVIAIAIIGFLNEYKAEKTVEALMKLVGQKAKVRRNGEIVDIDAVDLVPGDIVLFEEGQKVPADVRLLTVKSLQINEASLTGESLPVSKTTLANSKKVGLGDQKCMAFAGTFVTAGTAEGVVVATGQTTELGKIADMVNSVEEDETPMQKKLDDLGKKLGIFIMVICAVVFVIVFFFVREAIDKTFLQRLIFAFTAAVALAVAAIPEGLAFVVRISLALGARRMAAKNALVRKLSAVEALGSTDVICSDKTGTLTKGEMTVRSLYVAGEEYEMTGSGYDIDGDLLQKGKKAERTKTIEKLVTIGALCNNARIKDTQVLGDPTEGALLISATKLNLSYATLQEEFVRVDEIPFTSERKKMTTIHKQGDKYLVASKGALEMVLAMCNRYVAPNGKITSLSESAKNEIIAKNKQFASNALRVLAFAYKEGSGKVPTTKEAESDLIFVGLQAMMDPPRKEVIDVIHRVQAESGMRVVMITGDYIDTAVAVAKEIGIEGEAVSGMELDEMSQAEFEERVEEISVYARVNPEHKIRIVQALKKCGHQVAMTGDGVNDAPAIKAADIGIAMGINGTDAAKEAADLILLDDQFLTIINAIEEGRGIFDNVRKFVNFLISCNIAEVIVILLGIIFFNNLLLTAAQLLFINIVTDGLPAVALGSDPAQRDALKAKPSKFQEAILTKRVWVEVFVFGFLMSAVMLGQFWYNHTHEGSLAAVSAAFTAMVVYEMVRLIDIRTDYKIRWFSNPWLSVAIASSLALQFAVLYIKPLAESFEVGPLSSHDWVIMAAGSIMLFVIMKALNPLFDKIGPEKTTH